MLIFFSLFFFFFFLSLSLKSIAAWISSQRRSLLVWCWIFSQIPQKSCCVILTCICQICQISIQTYLWNYRKNPVVMMLTFLSGYSRSLSVLNSWPLYEVTAKVSLLVECCFTSTETVCLLGTAMVSLSACWPFSNCCFRGWPLRLSAFCGANASSRQFIIHGLMRFTKWYYCINSPLHSFIKG